MKLYKTFGVAFASIIFIIGMFFLHTNVENTYGEGTHSSLGTGDSADGSNDAINFSQGRVWTIDQYGKYIWLTQLRTGPSTHWAWSNDLGATWAQSSESYSALTRGSVAYDSINDVLHVIWNATDTNDGIIYRRYSITRDGSNNITSIQRMDSASINLQLDTSISRSLEQPVALWVNDGSADGSLVAIWLKQGTSMTEIRGSMRKLTMSAADGVAGNWQALDNSADVFSTDPPAVSADKIYGIASSSRVAAGVTVRGGTGSRKDDLYVFAAAANSSNVLAYRAVWNSANKDWRGGFQSAVTVGSMVATSGYSLKEQLVTKPVLDSANDRLYVGWARWKDGVNGDTVSIAYLDSLDTASSTIDIYSSLGTHSYAPTLDIAYDQTLGKIYVAYIESTTNGNNGSINYKTYDGTTLSTATRFYTSPGGSAGANGSADIPVLYQNRTSNDRLLFAFRKNGALPPTAGSPHTIFWGYETLATPTPIPTATPAQSSSSSSSSSSPGAVSGSCTASPPTGSPSLYQIDVQDTQAQIQFAPASGEISKYTVSYGYSAGDERFNAEIGKGSGNGAISFMINNLSPNTTYFIKLRADNNCKPGTWSNEMKIVTTKNGSKQGITYFKNFASRIRGLFPRATTSVGSSNTNQKKQVGKVCEYVVQSGDTLWNIASDQLASGSKYQDIIAKNTKTYPTIKNTVLRIGWKLNIAC